MFRIPKRLLGAVLAFSCLSFLPAGQAHAHRDDAYYHDYHDLPSQSRWMAMLDDNTPLIKITMPGTHGSAARHGGWFAENQTLTIPQQLNAGIRYLDLRGRHIRNKLELHHGFMYQHMDLDDALRAVVSFLDANPTETVLIRLTSNEHTPHMNTRSLDETIDAYYANYQKHFAVGVGTKAPLSTLRGKAVMLRNFDARDKFRGIDFLEDMYIQDAYLLGTNWDLYGKWEHIKATIDIANRINGGESPVMPFVNHLSGSGGSFPFFVASGHGDPRTDAPGLVTGKVTPFFNDWPDFPRGSCFWFMCTIYFEGTNTLTKNYLINNPDIRYAGIIVADFPGAGLIQAIINVNFNGMNHTAQKIHTSANFQCLDFEGGMGAGRKLITHPCYSGGQRFTVRGDQIMVGGLCLDAEHGSNVHGASVIAWPCHGGQNQRWKIESSGRIRRLMPGVESCFRVFGNRIYLWECHPDSDDLRFWLMPWYW
jgi:1-phosphatidylinositol phosphodiesterase